jgi:O-succinylbenzoate synthase
MIYQFNYHPYRKQFRQPLRTHHGTWKSREGIILTLTNEQGQKGLGEIAPLPWFGSETHQQALNFCQQLGATIALKDIYSIPEQLPACQFGFETALENLNSPDFPINSLNYSYLLPTGEKALLHWTEIYQRAKKKQNEVTLKWKIGIDPVSEEIPLFIKLSQALPKDVKLRLDANGGLNSDGAERWLSVTDKERRVEFLEQPLLPEQLTTMLQLSQTYSTPLALDESVSTLQQLKNCYDQGWRGIFVIKPAIVGSILKLRDFLQSYSLDAVFSSVFETSIGRQKALQLAMELTHYDRAVGFGLDHWFLEDEKIQEF